MKVVFALLVLAIAVSASPAPKAVDWPAVDAKTKEFHALVKGTLENIVKIAAEYDANIAAEVKAILDAHTPDALAILAEAQAAIDAQTLTVPQAEEIFDRLQVKLAEVQTALTETVNQLPEAGGIRIKEALENALVKGEELADEIYALLAA